MKPKFKVWDIKEKKFLKNIYKAMVGELFDMYISLDGRVMVRELINGNFEHRELVDVILIQWTGLKDKNNIDIYEEDIIHTDNQGNIWSVEYGCFGDSKYYVYNQLNSCREIEVDMSISSNPFFQANKKCIDLEIKGSRLETQPC